MATEYRGRQLSQPIVVADVLNGESIATLQSVFALTEADFLRLQGGPPATATLATVIFSGVVGYAISLGPKLETMLSGGQSQLTSGETKTIVIGIVIAGILYGIGYFLPNDRKNVLSRIAAHFQRAKASTHIFGGAQ